MTIEFIGIAATAPHSETEIAAERGDPVQPVVGSYEQVAQALLRYVELGVSTLLIRGFTPLADARDYGTLVRLVREQADPVPLVSAR